MKREIDPRSYRVDFTKLQQNLGFQPQWTIEDGIKKLHQALKDGRWPAPSDPRFHN